MTREEAVLRLEVLKDFSQNNELKNIHEAIDLAIRSLLTVGITKVICCKDCFYAKPYNAKWQLPIKEDALWCSHHEEEKTKGWFCADAIERVVE